MRLQERITLYFLVLLVVLDGVFLVFYSEGWADNMNQKLINSSLITASSDKIKISDKSEEYSFDTNFFNSAKFSKLKASFSEAEIKQKIDELIKKSNQEKEDAKKKAEEEQKSGINTNTPNTSGIDIPGNDLENNLPNIPKTETKKTFKVGNKNPFQSS
ncbi:MAG: hypothetical protein MUF50_03770 [Planctomycetes bacterium]|jgi:hypothetical protein|nr:hypothetical protein [Planctomycetota bacterium]